MKPKLSPSYLLSFIFCLLSFFFMPSALSQIPQGFNYQAIIRDGVTKQPIVSQPVLIRVTIEDGIGTDIFQETHSLSTDEFGIISIIVGQGTPWGTSDFDEIDWNDGPLNIKTEVQYPVGGSYTLMGTAPLMSVPYAMVADSLGGPLKNLKVKGTAATPDTEALFEVKNTTGQTVFAVYNEGVRIYVNDQDAKGPKGGFAIGGFGMGKTIPHQYVFISGDSVRFNIDNGDEDKGPKGGFAIGGFGTVKGLTQKYLMVSNDSVRIYVDNKETDKGPKGGFAIGGYGADKGKPQKLLTVSNDSVRIYINDAGKGPKGGFAIGGFDKTKGTGGNTNFFNVETEATEKIKPSEPRILWYPLKNAFLTGQVLIEHPDSVGQNSFAAGFETKPKGDYSQALGYKARTEGDNSTAIGNYAFAKGVNSFALGDSAYVSQSEGYAIGASARATGIAAFAIGSKNKAFGDNYTLATSASGNYSLAMGLDADASGSQSFAAGISVKAEGDYSVALGRSATASGDFAMALQGAASGTGSITIGGGSATAYNSMSLGLGTSSGWGSVVIGNGIANNDYSIALGNNAEATGDYAIAAGLETTAQAFGSFVIGYYNKISGTKESIVSTDPAFVIGNGTYITPSNAFTVLKNGYTAIGHDNPGQMLDVNGQVKIRGGSPAAGRILTSDADGDATWEPLPSHSHSASDLTSGTLTVARGGTGSSSMSANKVLVGGSGAVIYPANLHWDNTNSRLGILNTNPQYNIDVTGTMKTTSTTYLATSGGNVGIGTTSAGSYKMRVLSSGSGSANATSHFENTNSSGIALIGTTSSTDGTALLVQESTGYSLRCDGYDPSWFVAFIVKGRNVGVNTSSPSTNLDVNGNGRFRSIGSGAYTGPVNRTSDGTLTTATSDLRLKENIETITGGLNAVMKLRGITFTWKNEPEMGTRIGLVAQEVETVLPELVFTNEVDGFKGVNYAEMSAVLIEAVKEQQEQIESQQQQIDELKAMVEKLMVK